MKTILLHGLGQSSRDWDNVKKLMLPGNTDCPELFSAQEEELTYAGIMDELERRYAKDEEPLRLCGLSLGAVLALDFAARHPERTESLVLIAAQYKSPRLLIDIQSLIFRLMPEKSFEDAGISKEQMISLTRSMRSIDFTSQLKKLTCPVTIACGEKDSVNLRASKELCALLPQAQLRIVPGAGHEVNKTSPEAIAKILNE